MISYSSQTKWERWQRKKCLKSIKYVHRGFTSHTHTHTAGKQYYEGSTSCVDAYIYRSLYLLHDDTRFSRTGRRRRRINVTSFFYLCISFPVGCFWIKGWFWWEISPKTLNNVTHPHTFPTLTQGQRRSACIELHCNPGRVLNRTLDEHSQYDPDLNSHRGRGVRDKHEKEPGLSERNWHRESPGIGPGYLDTLTRKVTRPMNLSRSSLLIRSDPSTLHSMRSSEL